MIRSSSTLASPPSSLHHSSSISSRKTYSRRASAHKEKRKAQAMALSSDSDPDEDTDQHLSSSRPTRSAQKLAGIIPAEKNGSPVTRKDRQVHAGTNTDVLARPSAQTARPVKSRVSPARTPSPSPPPKRLKATHNDARIKASSSTAGAPKTQHPVTAPSVDVHPPSSSPPFSSDAPTPSTPPRTRRAKNQSRPTTPSASPNGFNELFEMVSPRRDYFGSPSNPASPGDGSISVHRPVLGRPGGLRRMLTKTQSLGVVADSPSKDVEDGTPDKVQHLSPFGANLPASSPSTPSRKLLRTQSLPESPSKRENLEPSDHQAQGQDQGSGGRARRTYGRTRTMLAEVSQVDLEIANLKDKTETIDDTGVQQSYAELREKFEVDNTPIERTGSGSGNFMSELLLARAPQTVSDMRAKGENRRFMDELNYLIDGMLDPSTGAGFKRASSIDVLTKMLHAEWMGKMEICGQVEKVWDCFREIGQNVSDEMMDAICLLFLAVINHSGSGIDQVTQNDPSKLINLVTEQLKVKDGPLDEGSQWRTNKNAQKLRQILRSLSPNTTSNSPSTRLLSSTILNTLCTTTTLPNLASGTEVETIMKEVLSSLNAEARIIADRFDLYEKGLSMLPNEDPSDLDHIYELLQIGAYLVAHMKETQGPALQGQDGLLPCLVHITIGMSASSFNMETRLSGKTSHIVIKAIDLLNHLTQESPTASGVIAAIPGALSTLTRLLLQCERLLHARGQSAKEVEAEESMQTEVDDEGRADSKSEGGLSEQGLFYLVLALLTHLVLDNNGVKERLASTMIAADCTGKQACLRICHCPSPQPTVYHLSALYTSFRSVSDDDPDARVAAGHLALLISLLLPSIETMENQALTALPGNDVRTKLAGLLVSLKGLKYEVRQTVQHLNRRERGESPEAEAGVEDDELDMRNVEDAITKLEELIPQV